MSEEEIYRLFIEWMKKSWYGLPEAEEMIPLIINFLEMNSFSVSSVVGF